MEPMEPPLDLPLVGTYILIVQEQRTTKMHKPNQVKDVPLRMSKDSCQD